MDFLMLRKKRAHRNLWHLHEFPYLFTLEPEHTGIHDAPCLKYHHMFRTVFTMYTRATLLSGDTHDLEQAHEKAQPDRSIDRTLSAPISLTR